MLLQLMINLFKQVLLYNICPSLQNWPPCLMSTLLLFFHQESSKSSIIDSHNLMPQAIMCLDFVQGNGGANCYEYQLSCVTFKSIKHLTLMKRSLFTNTLPEMLSDLSDICCFQMCYLALYKYSCFLISCETTDKKLITNATIFPQAHHGNYHLEGFAYTESSIGRFGCG